MFGKKKAEEVKQDDSQQKQETSEKKRSGVISVVMISIMAAIFIAAHTKTRQRCIPAPGCRLNRAGKKPSCLL